MNDARVKKRMTQRRAGRKPVASKKDELVPVDVLLGDGEAKVGRDRRISHALPYSTFTISGSCWVEIHCNQDEATIQRAIAACRQIADEEMRKDENKMSRILKAAAEALDEEK